MVIISFQVNKILKKTAESRTTEDAAFLNECQDVVDRIEKSAVKRNVLKQRTLEVNILGSDGSVFMHAPLSGEATVNFSTSCRSF